MSRSIHIDKQAMQVAVYNSADNIQRNVAILWDNTRVYGTILSVFNASL
jgi:hypothetical protein